MANTITVPEGFAAIVILIDKSKGPDDERVDLKILGLSSGDPDHEYVADAIAVLAFEQVRITDELIDEGGDGDGDDDPEETEEPS
jgi:hypothetical protein